MCAARSTRAGTKLLDARTQGEIDGKDLRKIKRGGFIESSIPVYWEDTLDPTTKAFKSAAEIQKLYRDRGVQAERRDHHLLPDRDARVARSLHARAHRPRPHQARQLLRLVGGMGQSRRHADSHEEPLGRRVTECQGANVPGCQGASVPKCWCLGCLRCLRCVGLPRRSSPETTERAKAGAQGWDFAVDRRL